MTPHELMVMLQLLSAIGHSPILTEEINPQPATFQIQESLAETAESIIRCYHPTAKYQTVDVIEVPWSRQKEWNATSSMVLRIHWRGMLNTYGTDVALIERKGKIRGDLLGDSALVPANRKCSLEDWVVVAQ